MTVVVCDDEKTILEYTIDQVRRLPSLESATIVPYISSAELVRDIELKQCEPDIVILDIQMEPSGFETARVINAVQPICQIIFLTSHLGFATQAYDVEHTYFLLKSEFSDRIPHAIEKALANLSRLLNRQITLTFDGRLMVLSLSSIHYIERIGHKTVVYSSSGPHPTYEPPQKVIQGNESRFIRCHNSFWVNPDFIETIGRGQIGLHGGAIVPISRIYVATVRKALMHHVAGCDKEANAPGAVKSNTE